MPKTTENDKRNLAICNQQIGWFDEIDVFPKIKRGYYALNRLVAQNLLDTRVLAYNKRQWKAKTNISSTINME